jgi:purine-binding chemotaxis protein CheW
VALAQTQEHAGGSVPQEFLSFRLGAEEYAIDIFAVREIRGYEKPTRIANAPDFIRGVVNLRGVIVPIIDLRIKFGLADPTYDALTVVIILNIAERVLGIIVDGVSDVIALAGEEIRPAPSFSAAVDAGFIRGLASVEGRLIVLMDIEAMVSSPDMALVDAPAVAA